MTLPLCTAAEMRELDRITIEELGIPGVVLMELAGRAVAERVAALAPGLIGYRVAVLAGAGNNGGDGYVAARHLAEWGADVTLFPLAPEDRIRGDARVHYDVTQRLDIPTVSWAADGPPRDLAALLSEYDCLVDALLGTGLDTEVRGAYREVIEAVNAARVLTVAVDLPSGLSADSGQPLGVAVEADCTVTFACPKLGLVTHPGIEFAGEVHVVDIGIPRHLAARVGVRCHLMEERDAEALLPQRRLGGHKGTYGHLLALAGSPGKTGAAVLCAQAAARVGAGLVTLALPGDALAAVAPQSLETMSAAYAPSSVGLSATECAIALSSLVRGKTALVAGPGIPTGDAMGEALRELLSHLSLPAVLDADALNLLAGRRATLGPPSAPRILTPHPGEMARLLGIAPAEVQADRVKTAREASSRFGALVALKGARTVLATPDGEVFINPTGNPGMGSGGMGDVLAGMVGGLLAQGLPPFDALRLAVYAHGLAGDRAAERVGQHALVASDLLGELPGVLRGWEASQATT